MTIDRIKAFPYRQVKVPAFIGIQPAVQIEPRLLFDSEITGDEHNQMRTCVHVACALLLAITAVRVHRADYVSGHPQGSVLGIGGDHECEAEVCELRVEACVEQDVPALGILVHVVESTCHVQRDLDMLAPSEHLVAVEPLAKRAVLGELEHHKLGLDDL
uniref:Uncharacterized protein n=1 Tax=Aegilops tauschii TaxID=37682 RepID=M8CCX8_AEGTA